MLPVDKHISELLYDHDCVIVPSLGGFLASNLPARINVSAHSISAPYRRIAFNVYLKQNDGLLANHLVEFENISYAEAIRNIELFVNNCYADLESGKIFRIEKIGALQFDREQNIQFEADHSVNHLKESFGMQNVQLNPVTTEKEIQQQKIRPSLKSEKKKIKIGRRKTVYLSAVVISGALLWFAVNLYLVSPKNYSSSSLNPFENHSSTEKNIPEVKPVIKEKPATAKVETVFVAPVQPEANNISEKKIIAEPQKKADLPVVQQSSPANENHHYIVAGVFKINDNAAKELNTLQSQGFASAGISEAHNLYYVYFDRVASPHEAIVMVDSLKEKGLSSWIWNY